MSKVCVRATQLVAAALVAGDGRSDQGRCVGSYGRCASDDGRCGGGCGGGDVDVGHGSGAISKQQLIELAQCVRLSSVRDEVSRGMSTRSARAHLGLWLLVASVAPPEAVAAPLALAALSAWLAGERNVFKRCLDRGLALAPDYRLFPLLLGAYLRHLPPSKWEELQMSK
ncbi:MAG: DUF4192 domain-containing protein [Propionibacteriaceae bacterium]|nr:DUF4192 domain-containing protein [Propionibacteriaceae bacterium]